MKYLDRRNVFTPSLRSKTQSVMLGSQGSRSLEQPLTPHPQCRTDKWMRAEPPLLLCLTTFVHFYCLESQPGNGAIHSERIFPTKLIQSSWRGGSVIKSTDCSSTGRDLIPWTFMATICSSGSRESDAVFWPLASESTRHVHGTQQKTKPATTTEIPIRIFKIITNCFYTEQCRALFFPSFVFFKKTWDRFWLHRPGWLRT